MALKLEDKKAIVAEVAQVAAKAVSAVAAEYRGLTVGQMMQLRANARKEGIYVRVVQNTLARRAVEGTAFQCMQDALVGPLVLAFGMEEPGAVARVIKSFVKEHEKLVVKVVSIDGQLLPAKELDALAKLPSRHEALSSLAAVLQAPIAQMVRTFAEPHAKLVRTFAAVARQKEQAA